MAKFEVRAGSTHQEPIYIIEADNTSHVNTLIQRHLVKTTGGKLSRLVAFFFPPKILASELESHSYVFAQKESVHPLLHDTFYTCGRFVDVAFQGKHFEYIVNRLP
ncbi:MAG: hypothetical protein G01um101448_124 [Parcubacteria group bacterium Gr01-1014_48]|nr:MAG: hypothetical protein Greene041614_46 [Parcubacteria group bacterium Greene0416_14]TSC74483.1 MAG: hypothetical protein G01um101448_124 [Parcubacteria group bacterium Gr01-1014_48]TSD01794.1 MAG: hypothetical protein Greene101415_52 [Parcubacteria group bacterium Greene1014_15]TSD08508.1 MAG: hypothetical protein Greene07144_47 [Parcubacteria group bacterium Greene0714_4]